MRLSSPRVPPLSDAELTPDQEEALKPVRNGTMGVLNIFRTLAHAPKALTRFNDWGGYVLSRRNDLPAREREIVILRFVCELSQSEIAERLGISQVHVSRLLRRSIEQMRERARAAVADGDARVPVVA
jgi:predicted DNA-binding protein (UPF0251 family)